MIDGSVIVADRVDRGGKQLSKNLRGVAVQLTNILAGCKMSCTPSNSLGASVLCGFDRNTIEFVTK